MKYHHRCRTDSRKRSPKSIDYGAKLINPQAVSDNWWTTTWSSNRRMMRVSLSTTKTTRRRCPRPLGESSWTTTRWNNWWRWHRAKRCLMWNKIERRWRMSIGRLNRLERWVISKNNERGRPNRNNRLLVNLKIKDSQQSIPLKVNKKETSHKLSKTSNNKQTTVIKVTQRIICKRNPPWWESTTSPIYPL